MTAIYLLTIVIFCGVGNIFQAAAHETTGEGVRLNQITVKGSHNSYHVAPPQAALELLARLVPQALQWNQTQLPLQQQLSDGMRVLELDVLYDPEGGRYNYSNILQLSMDNGTVPGPDLNVPGFKVGHVPDGDFGSNCRLLTTCLSRVRQWSLQHPNHLPITIYLEFKSENLYSELVVFLPSDLPSIFREFLDMIQNLPSNPLPVTVPALRALEQEVLSVFPRDAVLTPDQVRGSHGTLEEAILTDGWPLIEDVRGKVIFVLIPLDARATYHELAQADGNVTAAQAQTLYRRLFFTAPRPGAPDAAFVTDLWSAANNTQLSSILTSLVETGYIVRMNAEAGDTEPNPDRKAVLLASGVQYIVSDYLPNTMQSARYNPPYVGASLPGAPCGSAICNPVAANAAMCNSSTIGEYISALCTDDAADNQPPASQPPPSPSPPPSPPTPSHSASSTLYVVASWLPALLVCSLVGGQLI